MTVRNFFRVVCLATVLCIAHTGVGSADDGERQFSELYEVNEAIKAARATIDVFWNVAGMTPCDCSYTTLSVRYAIDGVDAGVDVEDVVRLSDGLIEGTVREYDVMSEATRALVGQRIRFGSDQIRDWGYGRNDKWYGFFLLNAAKPGPKELKAAAHLEAEVRERVAVEK